MRWTSCANKKGQINQMCSNAMSSQVDLDEIDLMLIKELEVDARQTTRDIGAKVGVSAATVSIRLRRMIGSGIINLHTLVDPIAIGFHVRVLWGLRVAPGKSADVMKDLIDCKSVQMCGLTTGGYDILMYTPFRNNQEMINWVSGEFGCITDIITAEALTIVRVEKNSHMFLRGDTTSLKESLTKFIDESDAKLIKELEINPRENLGTLAKQIGMTRQTVARKLKTLQDEHTVQIVSIVDPTKVGFVIPAFIFARIRPSCIVPVARSLANDSRVRNVSVLNGRFNMMVFVPFRCLDEMSSFLIDDLGHIPGIIDHETMIQTGRLHRTYRLMS